MVSDRVDAVNCANQPQIRGRHFPPLCNLLFGTSGICEVKRVRVERHVQIREPRRCRIVAAAKMVRPDSFVAVHED